VLEYTDVNRMTLRRFERLLADSQFVPSFSTVHAVWNLNPVIRVPWIRELFASQVDCVLEKSASHVAAL
jgi:hypothetical protein